MDKDKRAALLAFLAWQLEKVANGQPPPWLPLSTFTECELALLRLIATPVEQPKSDPSRN